MFGVISSYRELTSFEPVELTDNCSAAEVIKEIGQQYNHMTGKNVAYSLA